MDRKKTFDCVEMKHRGGDAIYAKIKGMTPAEQAAYWQTRHAEFVAEIARLRHQDKDTRHRIAPAA
jgi:hypothetical protein